MIPIVTLSYISNKDSKDIKDITWSDGVTCRSRRSTNKLSQQALKKSVRPTYGPPRERPNQAYTNVTGAVEGQKRLELFQPKHRRKHDGRREVKGDRYSIITQLTQNSYVKPVKEKLNCVCYSW